MAKAMEGVGAVFLESAIQTASGSICLLWFGRLADKQRSTTRDVIIDGRAQRRYERAGLSLLPLPSIVNSSPFKRDKVEEAILQVARCMAMEAVSYSSRLTVFGILKTPVVCTSQNNLNLMYDVESEDIPDQLICDFLRLRQVITNLVSNAITFIPSNVALTTRLLALDDQIMTLKFFVFPARNSEYMLDVIDPGPPPAKLHPTICRIHAAAARRLAKWTLNQYYEKMDDAEVSPRIASRLLHPRHTLHYFKAASVLKLEDVEVVLDDEWDTIQL
ncbi:hypothetical protein F5887DRAFT_1175101 [Amanita rubescens]|nr:hypothetical protein F5887DRAFT_1175101 [Amanita rubescens]